jgi:CRAL/TRIO domain
MTSWPWMKGVDVAIVLEPIDPVTEYDDRKAVKDLLQEHCDKISQMKASLQDDPLYDESMHDDLWILRFFLSHKNVEPAIKAAKHTLEFRKQYNLDEWGDIRATPPHQVKEGNVFEYLQCWEEDALIFTHPDPKRGVICFLKLTSMDQHKAVETLTEDYWLSIFMYCAEWSFQWNDYVTRTTGRLTRSIRFVDASGIGWGSFNRECSRRDGNAMRVMEDCYPQMLESIFMCNPPGVVKMLWGIVRVILPERVVAKFDMINPSENEEEKRRLYKHITEEHLPEKYGGKNPVSPERW